MVKKQYYHQRSYCTETLTSTAGVSKARSAKVPLQKVANTKPINKCKRCKKTIFNCIQSEAVSRKQPTEQSVEPLKHCATTSIVFA